MTRSKIGNLFVVGYQGVNPSDEFLRFIEEWQIGGVIVFARNIDRLENMTAAIKKIQEAAGREIFTAIDQEGGLVMRLLQDCSLFQSAMGLAATGDEKLIEASHAVMAKEMLALGLNWNLAPVLDINHPDNPGIGARSFGDTAENVARYGCAAIRGLQSQGVLACAKHFPGKGDARVDSHLTLPIIDQTREQLDKHGLFPFKQAIANDVGAIMTAHVFFPAYESTPNLPATLSRSVLTGLLRDELNFEGLLITDDLEMGAITEKFGIAEAASQSFAAGSDLLLICHQLEQQREAAEKIMAMVAADPAFGERLETSLTRIERARDRIKSGKFTCDNEYSNRSHQELIEITHDRSLRFLDFEAEMLQLKSNDEVVFVYPRISSLVQVEETHSDSGIAEIFGRSFKNPLLIQYDPKESSEKIIERVEQEAADYAKSRLIFMTYNAHIFEEQITAANSIVSGFKSGAAFALRNPYDLKLLKGFKTRAAAFSFRTPALHAILKALSGKTTPQKGPWPIDISQW